MILRPGSKEEEEEEEEEEEGEEEEEFHSIFGQQVPLTPFPGRRKKGKKIFSLRGRQYFRFTKFMNDDLDVSTVCCTVV